MSEAPTGKPLVPKRWPAVTSATVAFGHGLAASPLHLAAAYATVANGGKRVTPTLIHDRVRREGEQVLSPQAARTAVQLLRQVVVRGSGRSANVEGYEVAGKTGTADKPRPSGGYYGNKVVSTFASVFPASDPKYVLVLSLDEPTSVAGGGESRTAGMTAAPVAGETIRRVAPLLGLRPITDKPLPMVERPAGDALKLVSN